MKHLRKFNDSFEIRDDIKKNIESRKQEREYRKKYPLSLQQSEIDTNSIQDIYDELVVLCHDSLALSKYIEANNPNKDVFKYGTGLLFRVCIRGSWKSPNDIGESYTDSFKVLMKYSPLVLPYKNLLVKWVTEYGRVDILDYLKDKGYFDKFDDDDYDNLIKWIQITRMMNEEIKRKIIYYINSLR
jgi:hypothetical protein